MNQKTSRQSGFTIIELTLAMAFVSLLLVAIALTVIQIINIYNKGMTMKDVNQAGRAISTDIRQTLSESEPFDPNDTEHKHSCLQNANGGCEMLSSTNSSGSSDPLGGRLCTGTYSYIWNYKFKKNGSAIDPLVNIRSSGKEVRFVRVRDASAKYCANIRTPIDDTNDSPVELLSADSKLVLQGFTIDRVANDPSVGEALYRLTIVIGTDDSGAIKDTNTMNALCKPPSEDEGLQNFCAVNRFDFTALAGNKGGGS